MPILKVVKTCQDIFLSLQKQTIFAKFSACFWAGWWETMVNTQSVPSLPCLSFVADFVSHFVAHFVWCFVSHCISHFVSYFAPHLFPTVCLKLFQTLSPTVLPTLFPYCVALSLESSLLLGCDAPVKKHGWLIAAEKSQFAPKAARIIHISYLPFVGNIPQMSFSHWLIKQRLPSIQQQVDDKNYPHKDNLWHQAYHIIPNRNPSIFPRHIF